MVVTQAILLRAEAQIALAIEPHHQWLCVGYKEPLPYVELGLEDDEGPFCAKRKINQVEMTKGVSTAASPVA